MIPYTLVLEPGLVIYSVYNGYWYWGRPAPAQLRADLRAVTEKVRPDWDITAPGLRDAWERGDKSAFWPYGKTLREVFAAEPSAGGSGLWLAPPPAASPASPAEGTVARRVPARPVRRSQSRPKTGSTSGTKP
jgi:hypothetical protein